MKYGLINIFGGFSFDGGKIIEELGLHEDVSEAEDEIQREKDNLNFKIGAMFNSEILQELQKKVSPTNKRTRGKSTSDEYYSKKQKTSTSKYPENKADNLNESQADSNKFVMLNSDISSSSSCYSENRKGKKTEKTKREKREQY